MILIFLVLFFFFLQLSSVKIRLVKNSSGISLSIAGGRYGFHTFSKVSQTDYKYNSEPGVSNSLNTGCLNIHGTYATVNKSKNNNLLLFCFRFEIVYYKKSINPRSQCLVQERKYFASLLMWRQNHLKPSQRRCNLIIS